MPRRQRVLQSAYPYHVTLRAHNKTKFEMDISQLWLFSCDLLLFCTYAFKVEIHSFVLMNNHYHMLIRTPEANLDKFMNYFNRELSREISYKTGNINQKFGARYHSSVISDLRYYGNVYKYVYRNPVEANLSSSVQDYPYSSLSFILGRDMYRFPIFDSYFELIDDHWPTLNWLNTTYADLELKKIKLGLLKSQFIV